MREFTMAFCSHQDKSSNNNIGKQSMPKITTNHMNVIDNPEFVLKEWIHARG